MNDLKLKMKNAGYSNHVIIILIRFKKANPFSHGLKSTKSLCYPFLSQHFSSRDWARLLIIPKNSAADSASYLIATCKINWFTWALSLTATWRNQAKSSWIIYSTLLSFVAHNYLPLTIWGSYSFHLNLTSYWSKWHIFLPILPFHTPIC